MFNVFLTCCHYYGGAPIPVFLHGSLVFPLAEAVFNDAYLLLGFWSRIGVYQDNGTYQPSLHVRSIVVSIEYAPCRGTLHLL